MSEITTNDYCYDIETYPNVWTCWVGSLRTGRSKTFEISRRTNDLGPFKAFIERIRTRGCRMVGYNNEGYDYPVIHYLLTELANVRDVETLNRKLFEKSKQIIEAPHFKRFAHVIWPRDQIVPQIDLFKIHHFDNVAKSTSLKMLEFNMRMKDIRDLPFSPETVLTFDQIEHLVGYNEHDGDATKLFHGHTLPMIRFRESLSAKYDRNFLNHNDTKIGKDYFIMQLERYLGKQACFTREGGKKKPRQTIRKQIALDDVIFEYVHFETEPFQAVEQWLRQQVITETKGVFSKLPLESMLPFIGYSPVGELEKVQTWLANCEEALTTGEEWPTEPKVKQDLRRLSVILDGLEFVFGTGGIHASVHNKRIESDDDYVIIDLDVTSYYPSLAIVNRVYPEHLGERFCDIYADIKAQRLKYKKGTPENAMLKLALNGVYGDSNNKHSPFYDPQYTMAITVNGQLSLCMLYEQLRKIEGLSLIQVNTDGLTVKLPRDQVDRLIEVKSEWEAVTGLDLEDATYDFMHIRDVNNYVAKYAESDKVKRKGAYAFIRPDEPGAELGWHQNHSSLVVQKAACAYIVDGTDIRDFIECHDNDWDFLLRTKVPRSSYLEGDWGLGLTETYQNISRYYIANEGPELFKVMPPLPKDPEKWRRMAINKGWKVHVCNHFTGIDPDLINYDWYVAEAEKLVNFAEREEA
ncbi:MULTISPECIES: hypothetical protein [unclassified Marinobacter]|uniref:hypothetical protein n=1 Tax=unclassified Marinobacter TaxID=83889 RepID=UPI001267AB1D|nr:MULTISPECIES: hypothetical protein [unclassified Marinobacter]QFS86603.1 hypothetical protein FIV08_07125 [Marinobacter sp. THAF197a]QFT50387.1 hypothetical protein FIU96_07055 [Marinobacter sp. THAF39]QFT52909.1 hypothetical protein FIU96_19860 [Marinobacter sp. THAF39]